MNAAGIGIFIPKHTRKYISDSCSGWPACLFAFVSILDFHARTTSILMHRMCVDGIHKCLNRFISAGASPAAKRFTYSPSINCARCYLVRLVKTGQTIHKRHSDVNDFGPVTTNVLRMPLKLSTIKFRSEILELRTKREKEMRW